MNISTYEEILPIFDLLEEITPRHIDGKQAIIEMRDGGSRNWRQMEWIGFWFEFFVEKKVVPRLGGRRGPKYGTTEFDFRKRYVWDLKSHPNTTDSLILNDQIAIRSCIADEGGLGFIIVSGDVKYDDNSESFKKWHNSIKGKISKYETERIERGAPSRRRKISFSPEELTAIWFEGEKELLEAKQMGWLISFQENMRNSNGKPRPGKYQIELDKLPHNKVLAKRTLN